MTETEVKKVPYEFKNESLDGKHVMTLSGSIRKRMWIDDEVIDAKVIRQTLDDVKEDIVIKLNSPGGDVFQGIEICNYLKDHSSKVTVEVMGTAASAATFILAGADEVIMNVGTTVMIHEASSYAWGNKNDLKKAYDALETIDRSILDIYKTQTGQSEEQLEEWIKTEKWFTADEAVKYGFADVVKRKKESDELRDEIVEIVEATISKHFAAQAHELPIAATMDPVLKINEADAKQEKKALSLFERMHKGV